MANTKRERIIRKYNHICQICRKRTNQERYKDYPELDHIVPRSAGGSNEESNLILLCNSCNNKKSDLFGMKLILKILDEHGNATSGFYFELLKHEYKNGNLTSGDIKRLIRLIEENHYSLIKTIKEIPGSDDIG